MITIPTIAELTESILADLEAEFDATIDDEGKTMLRSFAAVQAGKMKQLYLAIATLQKNVFPDTCDRETLIRFGLVKLGRQPFQAVAGRYDVTVTGTIGTEIPAGTIFKTDDDALNPGILYRLDTAFTFVSNSGSINLRSLTLGEESKLEVGDTLTVTAPVAGMDNQATVTAETVQPLAAETDEDYRQEVLDAFRMESLGGAATDYRLWAQDAQGVQQVYPYARAGFPCEINLFIEATTADSSDGKGTPTQSIIDAVEEVINFDPDTTLAQNERGRRPLQVVVHYLAVTVKNVAIVIDGFEDLDSDTQADILAALQDMISDIRPFVSAADRVEDRNDTLNTNKVVGAIITAKPGAVFGTVTIYVDGVSHATYQFVDGNIPYLQSVSYT